MNIEKLIECVRKHPCLYETRNSAYKNVPVKARLWEDIGIEINQSAENARKKWKSLRDNYKRHKKEMAGTTGQAAKKYEKWPWVSQLQFLDVTLTERERTTNTTTHTEIPPDTPPDKSPPPEITNEVTEEGTPQNSVSRLSRTKRPKKDRSDIDKVIDFIQNKKKTESDATDNLFKSYAQIFKKLSLKNQIHIKLEMAKLFAEIELKDAEENAQITYSPVYSVFSGNSDTQTTNNPEIV